VAGIVSPTHDAYGKKVNKLVIMVKTVGIDLMFQGLVPGEHRLNMCRLATESSDWLRCVNILLVLLLLLVKSI